MDLLKNIFKGDKVIWIIFLMLCMISVVEVFSATSSLAYRSGDYWQPITRHSLYLLFGVGIVVLVHNVQYKWFQAIPFFLLPVSYVLLVLVMFMGVVSGDRVNGAARWFSFFGIEFQPSEFAKMAIIIVTAFILSKKQTEEGANPNAFKYIMIITMVGCALIAPENWSTAALLFGTVYLMMFIGRVEKKKLLLTGAILGSLMALFVTFLLVTPNATLNKIPLGHRFSTWKERISDFSSEKVPAAKFDINENGQVGHARIAIATSNVVGKGPGNSVQRDFLSQAYSDFIYAIVIEELGLVGGIVVVFLYICLLVRAGRIAQKCNRTFPAFLVLGIALLLVIQALFNMMVAVGLAPVTGQPLPLISRGGTSIVINCAYVGMILSVSRYTEELEQERLRNASIPLTVTVGADEYASESDMAANEEPVSEVMNNDTELE